MSFINKTKKSYIVGLVTSVDPNKFLMINGKIYLIIKGHGHYQYHCITRKKIVNQQNRLLKTHTIFDVMVLPGFS